METNSPVPMFKAVELFNFPDAIRKVIEGNKIARQSWDDKEVYCLLKGEWLSIYTGGEIRQWVVNDGDLLGEDWYILDESN